MFPKTIGKHSAAHRSWPADTQRKDLDLPDWFLPLGPGAVVAADHLLRDIRVPCWSRRPGEWHEFGEAHFVHLLSAGGGLRVREIGYTGLWTVEHFRPNGRGGQADLALLWQILRRFGCVLADAGYGLSAPFRQVLVHSFESTLIVAPSYQTAMQLAIYLQTSPPRVG